MVVPSASPAAAIAAILQAPMWSSVSLMIMPSPIVLDAGLVHAPFAGSVQLAELKHFPFGFDPFETLSVVDYGDAFIDPHHPAGVFDAIESHADAILDSGAMMLSLGGDHSVAYPLLKAHAKKHGPLALVQSADAHCDTWPYDGTRSIMVLRSHALRLEGIIDVAKSTQVGLHL